MDSLPELLRIPAVVLGIGLVIFVHELGHFIAARLCGVRVLTFSLGFGPKLFGWTRGATTYQIAAFPLGGFVRMAGEELREDDSPPLPDELPAKSVGQRFLIYSGGVVMNVVFALVVFPILFQVGVPFLRPVVGTITPGSPAWHADLPLGDEIVAVNGVDVFDFGHVLNAVALGDTDDCRVLLRDPETKVETLYTLHSEKNEFNGFPMIGVGPGTKRAPDGTLRIAVREDSAAARAGLTSEDTIVSVRGAVPGAEIEQQLGLEMLMGETLELEVKGPNGVRDVRLEPAPDEEQLDRRIGIQPPVHFVADVRETASTRRAGVRKGDRVLSIGGTSVRSAGDAARLLAGRTGPVELDVLRNGSPLTLSIDLATPTEGVELAKAWALEPDIETANIIVFPNGAAERAGLRTGDRVLAIDGVEIMRWENIQTQVERGRLADRPLVVRVERGGAEGEAVFQDITIPAQASPSLDYGLSYVSDVYTYQTRSFPEAVRVGAMCSWRFLEDAWLTLKRMVTRQVSPKNMGGIIMISAVSYEIAGDGLAKLFFFLCLLSMNLAFVNVLPIPLLDGGHLFFLVIEKLKGSPVSDRIMGYSQMVGVVLILSLMVYVTYNDFVRVFGG